ncbi:hypothetical protein C2S53_004645 [Perilla frutescens var. hirtella]|uniref:RIN4 pathogenic type III effector avirulence factor Avr cleavage site domain-containing protein n=1 Tax=Perilla frutescens var. hirtella TaxID=608512 RepID=A0AAD4PCX7_PERFH|nr:hypothetical protein C2S53_004645 [Perilla frutescens var. hirtella]
MDINGKARRPRVTSSVPQFGAWDGKSETNYSVVFQEARANKKKNKHVISHHNLGDDRELLPKRNDAHLPLPVRKTKRGEIKKKKKKVLKCFGWLF